MGKRHGREVKTALSILEKTGQLLPKITCGFDNWRASNCNSLAPPIHPGNRSGSFAWLRLESRDRWRRKNIFSYASVVMRNILVDRARKRSRQLPMADIDSHMLEQIQTAEDCEDPQILAMHEVLQQLEKDHPEVGKMLQMRFFVGMSNQEIATATGISERTIQRKVTFGRAYLARKLQSPSPFTEAS